MVSAALVLRRSGRRCGILIFASGVRNDSLPHDNTEAREPTAHADKVAPHKLTFYVF